MFQLLVFAVFKTLEINKNEIESDVKAVGNSSTNHPSPSLSLPAELFDRLYNDDNVNIASALYDVSPIPPNELVLK